MVLLSSSPPQQQQEQQQQPQDSAVARMAQRRLRQNHEARERFLYGKKADDDTDAVDG